jgi:hypothetical protein
LKGWKSSNIWEKREQIEILFRKKLRADWIRERLLLFGAESVIFQFTIQKVKDQDIQNYNTARCSVWV